MTNSNVTVDLQKLEKLLNKVGDLVITNSMMSQSVDNLPASEEKKTSRYKEKYTTTIINKYGVDNVSKLENIKQKKMETYISKFISKEDAISFKKSELLSGFKEYINDTIVTLDAAEKKRIKDTKVTNNNPNPPF